MGGLVDYLEVSGIRQYPFLLRADINWSILSVARGLLYCYGNYHDIGINLPFPVVKELPDPPQQPLPQ